MIQRFRSARPCVGSHDRWETRWRRPPICFRAARRVNRRVFDDIGSVPVLTMLSCGSTRPCMCRPIPGRDYLAGGRLSSYSTQERSAPVSFRAGGNCECEGRMTAVKSSQMLRYLRGSRTFMARIPPLDDAGHDVGIRFPRRARRNPGDPRPGHQHEAHAGPLAGRPAMRS